MNCLHITLTNCTHESRLLRHCSAQRKLKSVDEIFVAALAAENDVFEENQGVAKVTRFELKTRNLSKGLLVQLFKYIEFVIRVLFFYRRKGIELVVVHSVGLLPLGFLAKKLYGAALVYDAHELETERNGLSGIRKRMSKFVEKLFIRKVHLSIVVSRSIEKWYCNTYPGLDVALIMNTPSFSEFNDAHLDLNLKNRLGIAKDSRLALYIGSFSKGRCIEQLLDAFSGMEDDTHICFIGYGLLEEAIQDSAKNSRNIHNLPAVDPSEVVPLIKAADAGVCGVENTCLSYDFSMPNKLFEYIHAGVPVIVPDLTEMRRFVEDESVGVVVDDFSSSVKIREAISMCIEKREKYSEKASEVARAYSWQEQEKSLLAAYQALGVT